MTQLIRRTINRNPRSAIESVGPQTLLNYLVRMFESIRLDQLAALGTQSHRPLPDGTPQTA